MASREIVSASTVPIILSILIEGESYGYDIIRKVKIFSGGKLEWSEPMLYVVLHRLEKQGMIISSWTVLDNGRRRKYYNITAEGKELLSERKEEWMDILAILTKLWNLKLA